MKWYSYIFLTIFFGVLTPELGMAQRLGLGVSGGYNFQVKSIGLGGRLNFLVNRQLTISGQAFYTPGFNTIKETYLGGMFEYAIFTLNDFDFYVAAGGYYNDWQNAEKFIAGLEGGTNITPELGVGLKRFKGCVRPFGEIRYNTHWRESSAQVGIILFYGSCFKTYRNSPLDCPTFH